jgi:hypothetical protein
MGASFLDWLFEAVLWEWAWGPLFLFVGPACEH